MSSPNTWAAATVKNDWGSDIANVELHHRYDHDHYDDKAWASLTPGESGEPFAVGYWTGFGRTGYDYWLVRFEADGQRWTCKGNFYCFLTDEDAGGTVYCRVYKDGDAGKMEVVCPVSSSATVSLSSRPANPATRCDVTVVPPLSPRSGQDDSGTVLAGASPAEVPAHSPNQAFVLVGDILQPANSGRARGYYPMDQTPEGDRVFSVEAEGELTVDERQEGTQQVTPNTTRSLQCSLKFKMAPRGYILNNKLQLSFAGLDAGTAFGVQTSAPATGSSGPLSLKPTGALGLSLTLIEISTRQQIELIPPGTKLAVTLEVSIDAEDGKTITLAPRVGLDVPAGKLTIVSSFGQQQQIRPGNPADQSTTLIGPSVGLKFAWP
jgi:hypothetical protein